MKNRKYRLFFIPLLFIFFLTLPFIQSFIFSSNTHGSIEINKEVSADYIKSEKKTVLLFFGYVGCVDVCTPILYELDNLYKSKEFESLKDDVEILFVNLTPEVEQFQPDLFAKYFNDNFNGVHLTKRETLNLDRNFGIFFSRDLSDETELNHTDHIYLVENSKDSKILKKIYTSHPLNKTKIISDIMILDKAKDIIEK